MDNNLTVGVAGYDANSYELRVQGYSPEPLRDAAWKIIGQRVGGSVLDVGSGSGGWIGRLQQTAAIRNIVSVDIVDDGAGLLAGVEFHLADISRDNLPCTDAVADWIFALEVIEHLANPRHFIAEAYRALKQGGHLFLTTPCNDSLTARLSFLFRGYFPSFCEQVYREAGHITPITELDVRRMAAESRFSRVEFYYPLPGRIPKSSVCWQRIFPHLQGKLWSDGLFALLTK